MKAGWRLAKTVRKSVARDRAIFLYPILSGTVSVAVFILIFASLFIALPASSGGYAILFYIGFLFLAYIIMAFISTYILLSMLIAYRAFNSGNPVTMRNSLRKAWEYAPQALEWSLFYSVLIMILRIIESRIRGIGGILIGAMGSFMIAVATFFAIPSILDNKSGPIRAIEQSVSTIRKNFGETFGGVAYVDLYTLGFTLGGFIIFIIGLTAITSTVPSIFVAVLIIVGLILIALGIIFNFTYMNVLKMILFDYINGRGLPEGFNEADINAAIKRRGSGGMFSRNFSNLNNNFGN
jgi:hypothetical protein